MPEGAAVDRTKSATIGTAARTGATMHSHGRLSNRLLQNDLVVGNGQLTKNFVSIPKLDRTGSRLRLVVAKVLLQMKWEISLRVLHYRIKTCTSLIFVKCIAILAEILLLCLIVFRCQTVTLGLSIFVLVIEILLTFDALFD